jgi:hypothetical protein
MATTSKLAVAEIPDHISITESNQAACRLGKTDQQKPSRRKTRWNYNTNAYSHFSCEYTHDVAAQQKARRARQRGDVVIAM